MSATELQTIRTKAVALRTRNNNIEARVSSLMPPQYIDGKRNHDYLRWSQAMTLLGEQFASIQELIGMTK